MAVIVIGIVVVLALAAVFLVGTARRRAGTTGQLSRETRRADESAPVPVAVGATGEAVASDEDARARADESRRAIASGGAVPATTTGAVPAERVPVDEDELGVTRRQFFNRGILLGIALGVGGFGAAALAFLWPSSGGGFGGKVNIGSLEDIDTVLATKKPFYNAGAKTYVVPYPKNDLPKAKKVYGADPVIFEGMVAGYVALYQKCPHLGCRVPFCDTSQWFECPCHGSKYSRVGEKKGGPAPRGMDRFHFTISGGSMTVDTGTVVQGPEIGTDTTGQGQEGAPCV